ncbi:hypothetical protein ACEPAG_9367 [Sanghuangporus baumii]
MLPRFFTPDHTSTVPIKSGNESSPLFPVNSTRPRDCAESVPGAFGAASLASVVTYPDEDVDMALTMSPGAGESKRVQSNLRDASTVSKRSTSSSPSESSQAIINRVSQLAMQLEQLSTSQAQLMEILRQKDVRINGLEVELMNLRLDGETMRAEASRRQRGDGLLLESLPTSLEVDERQLLAPPVRRILLASESSPQTRLADTSEITTSKDRIDVRSQRENAAGRTVKTPTQEKQGQSGLKNKVSSRRNAKCSGVVMSPRHEAANQRWTAEEEEDFIMVDNSNDDGYDADDQIEQHGAELGDEDHFDLDQTDTDETDEENVSTTKAQSRWPGKRIKGKKNRIIRKVIRETYNVTTVLDFLFCATADPILVETFNRTGAGGPDEARPLVDMRDTLASEWNKEVIRILVDKIMRREKAIKLGLTKSDWVRSIKNRLRNIRAQWKNGQAQPKSDGGSFETSKEVDDRVTKQHTEGLTRARRNSRRHNKYRSRLRIVGSKVKQCEILNDEEEGRRWKKTQDVLEKLGPAGMSSDESDPDDGFSGTRVKAMPWRRNIRTLLVHIDSHRSDRTIYSRRGAKPVLRERRGYKETSREPVLNLPLSFYNGNWLSVQGPAQRTVLFRLAEEDFDWSCINMWIQ